ALLGPPSSFTPCRPGPSVVSCRSPWAISTATAVSIWPLPTSRMTSSTCCSIPPPRASTTNRGLQKFGESAREAAREVWPPSRCLTGPAFAPALGLRAGTDGLFPVPQTGSRKEKHHVALVLAANLETVRPRRAQAPAAVPRQTVHLPAPV